MSLRVPTETKFPQFVVTKRAVIYARVSTDEQAENGTSIDNQVEKSLAYAKAKEMQVAAIFREDFTGKVLERPELNKVRAMFQAGQADALIVYKTNRLDRSEWGVNLLILLQELKMMGVELHYSREGRQVNLNDPAEALMQSISGWQAGEDHRETVTKLLEGRYNKVRRGSIVTTIAPFGYCKIKVGKECTFEIEPQEAEIIRLIYTWYVEEGLTIYSICARLDEMAIATPAERGRAVCSQKRPGWSQGTLHNILKNEAYCGVWRYAKTKIRNGKQVKSTPPIDLTIAVPEIIDRPTWQAAQERLRINKEQAKRNRKNEYLIGGMVTCGLCGHKMGGRTRKEYKKKGLKKYSHYYCPNPACQMNYFRAGAVEEAIWEWLEKVFNDEAELEARFNGYQETSEQGNPLKAELAIVNNLIKQQGTDLNNALTDMRAAQSPRAKARISEDIARIEAQLDGLEERQKELQTQLETHTLTEAQKMTLREFAAQIRDDLATVKGNYEASRELMHALNLQVTLTYEGTHRRAIVTCKIGQDEKLSISYRRKKCKLYTDCQN